LENQRRESYRQARLAFAQFGCGVLAGVKDADDLDLLVAEPVIHDVLTGNAASAPSAKLSPGSTDPRMLDQLPHCSVQQRLVLGVLFGSPAHAGVVEGIPQVLPRSRLEDEAPPSGRHRGLASRLAGTRLRPPAQSRPSVPASTTRLPHSPDRPESIREGAATAGPARRAVARPFRWLHPGLGRGRWPPLPGSAPRAAASGSRSSSAPQLTWGRVSFDPEFMRYRPVFRRVVGSPGATRRRSAWADIGVGRFPILGSMARRASDLSSQSGRPLCQLAPVCLV